MRASVERLIGRDDTEYLLGGEPAMGVVQLRYRHSVWFDADDCHVEDVFVRARGARDRARPRARQRGDRARPRCAAAGASSSTRPRRTRRRSRSTARSASAPATTSPAASPSSCGGASPRTCRPASTDARSPLGRRRLAGHAGGLAAHEHPGRDAAGDDRARADERALADLDARQDHGARRRCGSRGAAGPRVGSPRRRPPVASSTVTTRLAMKTSSSIRVAGEMPHLLMIRTRSPITAPRPTLDGVADHALGPDHGAPSRISAPSATTAPGPMRAPAHTTAAQPTAAPAPITAAGRDVLRPRRVAAQARRPADHRAVVDLAARLEHRAVVEHDVGADDRRPRRSRRRRRPSGSAPRSDGRSVIAPPAAPRGSGASPSTSIDDARLALEPAHVLVDDVEAELVAPAVGRARSPRPGRCTPRRARPRRGTACGGRRGRASRRSPSRQW